MNKSKAVIILGTAHLDSTPGKCAPDKSIREPVYSREIVASVKAKLESYGYRVFIDYEPMEPKPEWTEARRKYGYEKGEQARELDYRAKQVNAICDKYGKENCLYVSIHLNGAGSDGKWHGAGGWCAFTTPGKTRADKLAECLYDAAFDNLKPFKIFLLNLAIFLVHLGSEALSKFLQVKLLKENLDGFGAGICSKTLT